MKRERGSISLEAVITLSVFMMVMMLCLGMLLTLYVDAKVQWCVKEVTDDIGLSPLDIDQHPLLLETALTGYLDKKLKKEGLEHFVKLQHLYKSDFRDDGVFSWAIHYKYTFLTPFKKDVWVVPVASFIQGDHLTLASPLVYITTYGKKYHVGTCRYLKKSKHPIDLEQAVERGYTPCSVCNPPPPP